MLRGFRDFLMRGNVVDLAVAVIIGVAFSGVVDGLIKGLIDPLIALAVPDHQLEKALALGPFRLGLVLSAFVTCVMRAGVVFPASVPPSGRRGGGSPPPPAAPPADVQLLT